MKYENPLHTKHCNEPNCKHPIDNTEGRLYTCKFHLDKQLPTDFKSRFIDYAVHSDTDECIEGPFVKTKFGHATMGNNLESRGVYRQVLILKSILDKNLPENYKDLVVRHAPKICHNPFCINPKHLSWGTGYDNFLDGVEDGTQQMLDPKIVMEIFNSDEKYAVLSKKYDVCISTISMIKTGATHSNITGKTYSRQNTWLSDEIVMEIFNHSGSTEEIMEKFDVSKQTISLIKTGYARNSLTGKEYVEKKTKLLDADTVLTIFNDPLPNNQLVKKYGVDKHTVSNIKVGKTYGDITGKQYTKRKKATTDKDKVLAIFNAEGTNVDIAKQFDVSHKLVSKIKTGLRHSQITGKEYIRSKKSNINYIGDTK